MLCTTEGPTRTLYAVQATVNGRQLPTFFLDADVQGITSEAQAERIAREIVGPGATVSAVRL